MNDIMRILLIRHGRQSSPLCNVNVPLAPEGRLQARRLGERLQADKPDVVFSSDLIRAVETAKIANELWQVPHVIRGGLREISFGDMEGMSDQEISVKYSDFLKEKAKMETDLPYPGGESAEDVARRAFPVLLEMTGQSGSFAEETAGPRACDSAVGETMESGTWNTVAVITHGGVIRSLLCQVLGLDFAKNRLFASHLENCGITELEYKRGDRRFYVNRVNDYSHLEATPELLRSGWSGKK